MKTCTRTARTFLSVYEDQECQTTCRTCKMALDLELMFSMPSLQIK